MMGLDGIYGTAPVAWLRPNALGIYDLGGMLLNGCGTDWTKNRATELFAAEAGTMLGRARKRPSDGVARWWPMTTLGSVWSEPRASKPRSLPSMWHTHGASESPLATPSL